MFFFIVLSPDVGDYSSPLLLSHTFPYLNPTDMDQWAETTHILEKVLLDPIFMILKCDFFTQFGSCFLKLHDVSTSHLEALVT